MSVSGEHRTLAAGPFESSHSRMNKKARLACGCGRLWRGEGNERITDRRLHEMRAGRHYHHVLPPVRLLSHWLRENPVTGDYANTAVTCSHHAGSVITDGGLSRRALLGFEAEIKAATGDVQPCASLTECCRFSRRPAGV